MRTSFKNPLSKGLTTFKNKKVNSFESSHRNPIRQYNSRYTSLEYFSLNVSQNKITFPVINYTPQINSTLARYKSSLKSYNKSNSFPDLDEKFQDFLAYLKRLGRKEGFIAAFQASRKHVARDKAEYTAITMVLSSFVNTPTEIEKLVSFSIKAWDQESRIHLTNAFIHRQMRQGIMRGFLFFNYLRNSVGDFNLRTIHLMLRNVRSRFGGLELAERVLLCSCREKPELRFTTKTYNIFLAIVLSHISNAKHLQPSGETQDIYGDYNKHATIEDIKKYHDYIAYQFDHNHHYNFDEQDISILGENKSYVQVRDKQPVVTSESIQELTEELLPFSDFENDIKQLDIDPSPPLTQYDSIRRMKQWCHWFENELGIEPDVITINTLLSINIYIRNRIGWWQVVRRLWIRFGEGETTPSNRSSVLLLLGVLRFQRNKISAITNILQHIQKIGETETKKNFDDVSLNLENQMSDSQMRLVFYLISQHFTFDASGITILLDEALNRKHKEYQLGLALIRIIKTQKIRINSRLVTSTVRGFFDTPYLGEVLSILKPKIPHIAFHKSQLEIIDLLIGDALAIGPRSHMKSLVQALRPLYPIGLRTTSLRRAFHLLRSRNASSDRAIELFHALEEYMEIIPSRVLNDALPAMFPSYKSVSELFPLVSNHLNSVSVFTIQSLMGLCHSVTHLREILQFCNSHHLDDILENQEETVCAHAVLSMDPGQLPELFMFFKASFPCPNLELGNKILTHLSERDPAMVQKGIELMIQHDIMPVSKSSDPFLREKNSLSDDYQFEISGNSETFDIILESQLKTQNMELFTRYLMLMLNNGLLWSQKTYEVVYWMARKTSHKSLAVGILEYMGRNGVWMRKSLIRDAKEFIDNNEDLNTNREQVLTALHSYKTVRDPNSAEIEPPSISFQ